MTETMRASRYELLGKIATGGMATVYAGRMRGAVGFSRLVAIKRPHPFVTADKDLRQQLEREAKVASLLHHPNVVSVLDVEEIDGEVILVMDYVEGCTLRDLLDFASSVGEEVPRIAVRILLDAAAGLNAAHVLADANGVPLRIVHRDVSPHNILVGLDGVARLADFGIAKIAGLERERTATEVLKGKLAYLPREYIEGRVFDARSDLYSLGVVAWEALAQERLYRGGSTVDTLRLVLAANPPLLGQRRSELAPFEQLVARSLATDPSARPESVARFSAELERLARAHDLLATHEEVGAFVERAAGAVVRDRRRALQTASAQLRAAARADVASAASSRDDVATLSVAAAPDSDVNARSLAALAQASSESASGPKRGEESRARPRRRGVLLIAGALAALGVAAATSARIVGTTAMSTMATTSSSMSGTASSSSTSSGTNVDLVTSGPINDGPSRSVKNDDASTHSDTVDAGMTPSGKSAALEGPAATRHSPVRKLHVQATPTSRASTTLPAHAPPNPYAK